MREWSNSEALDLLPVEETEAPPAATAMPPLSSWALSVAAEERWFEGSVAVVGSAPPRMVVDSIILDESVLLLIWMCLSYQLWMEEVWHETGYRWRRPRLELSMLRWQKRRVACEFEILWRVNDENVGE